MAINWTTLYQKYRGLWVALKDDEKTVIASGKTVRTVLQQAEEKGFNEPLLLHIPTELVPFVGA